MDQPDITLNEPRKGVIGTRRDILPQQVAVSPFIHSSIIWTANSNSDTGIYGLRGLSRKYVGTERKRLEPRQLGCYAERIDAKGEGSMVGAGIIARGSGEWRPE